MGGVEPNAIIIAYNEYKMKIRTLFVLLFTLLSYCLMAQKPLAGLAWTEVALGMPEAWYGSDESKAVAENVLLYQRYIGGWPKNIPMHHYLDQNARAALITDKSKKDAIFDNDATTTEMRFIARMYNKTRDIRYRSSFRKGLGFIFAAQYANGGWPMFYPLRKGYYTHITYNDNGMVNILKLLQEIGADTSFFAAVANGKTAARAKNAFDKGVKCILRTQYIQNGHRTVWCAQHDEHTLEPAPARSYELPSLSGSESAGIVDLLMSIKNPSQEVIRAVQSAMAWFDRVKIRGFKVESFVNADGVIDRRLVADRNASDLWARFYDLNDNRPFFCSRDGIKRYAMSEISIERRNGYNWYVNTPQRLYHKYETWQAKYAPNRSVIDLSGGGWSLWLDKEAQWQNDTLYLPPINLTGISAPVPTGGWGALNPAKTKAVNVPGTVEEYLQQKSGPEGDLTGVSWWFRTVRIPETVSSRKLLLRFDAVRYRCEVFVNQKLVGYDLVGNTPFEVDLSGIAKPGETIQLALRITDPGGNFDWKDWMTIDWGSYKVPGSHGFSGITGRVRLIVCDPVYIDDIYMRNNPDITRVTPQISIFNSQKTKKIRSVEVQVLDRNYPAKEVYRKEITNIVLKPGENLVPLDIIVPDAKIWDVENPNLYECRVVLKEGNREADHDQKIFGFRWFESSGVGKEAVFRLNGKRIVLRSAINWGFWPVNGIFPTDEQAEKEVRVAKSMGLNMLNFHRCIGPVNVLEKADELGLLLYEEPGNYRSGESPDNHFAHTLIREKVLRMVKRDRSHPSLIIYCLINEEVDPVAPGVLDLQTRDMRDAHLLDPSRILLRNSGLWPTANDVEEPQKYHMRPNDSTLYKSGWYDNHRAGGPSWWSQSLYRDPKNYYSKTDNLREITFWGEEGATSTPPRLGLIKAALDTLPNKGWDGGLYLDWYYRFDKFLTDKNMRSAFPTVDDLTMSMGAISLDTHGRKIEACRAANIVDGFAINGWESQILDNPSGIVDGFRNPKADPAILAYYNQPHYVAVKLRQQIIQLPGEVVADFFVINEKDLKGLFKLEISLKSPAGQDIFHKTIPVTLAGGEEYGQLIAEAITIPVVGKGGNYRLDARLIDLKAKEQTTTGHDLILGIDLKSSEVKGRGCVWEFNGTVKALLKKEKNIDLPDFNQKMDPMDWIVVTRYPKGSDFSEIPSENLQNLSGLQGITATYFSGQEFGQQVTQKNEPNVNLSVAIGDTPATDVNVTENYSVRWEGKLIPSLTGSYEFQIQASNKSRLLIDNKEIIIMTRGGKMTGKAELKAGEPVAITVEYCQAKNSGNCKLLWSTPEMDAIDPQKLFDRVRNDGTTLILLDYSNLWMDLIVKNCAVKFSGTFIVGPSWRGGVHFVKDHPLFKGLPINVGMGWPYQAVVSKANERYGLLMEGDELVAGAYHANPMNIGTAVGIIPCGKGKIILSTLDICSGLLSNDGPSATSRKLFFNFIEYTNGR